MGVISVIENRLYKLEDVIKPLLEDYPETREDDFELVMRVYEDWLSYSDYINMSFKDLMINHRALNLPPFASITRCRRKLQTLYPELSSSEGIRTARINDTATYIEYALDI